jgi:hypothetical protein
MIFKIFSPKNSAKKLAFLIQIKAELCKILIITLVFEKNANFFAENCRKSQKIVIITSTPDTKTKKARFVGGRGLMVFSSLPKFHPRLPDGLFSNQKSKFE